MRSCPCDVFEPAEGDGVTFLSAGCVCGHDEREHSSSGAGSCDHVTTAPFVKGVELVGDDATSVQADRRALLREWQDRAAAASKAHEVTG